MYTRNIEALVLAALADTPVVLLNGARQTGKSTLLRGISDGSQTRTVSLDDDTALAAIRNSAQAFLSGLTHERVFIDEIQRAPELFLQIKDAVDNDRRSGRFLLTGSANVLTLPRLADSLAGRMEILTLWPLAASEIHGQHYSLIDRLFEKKSVIAPNVPAISLDELSKQLIAGGYPEALARHTTSRRSAWFASYLTTILQRDVLDLSRIEGLRSLPNLLTLLATRAGGMLNGADLSRSLSLTNPTLLRYINLLKALYLIVEVPPWFTNRGKRLVKAPKIYLNDSGLLCHLLDITNTEAFAMSNDFGAVFENYVIMELLKHCSWSEHRPALSHYRTHAGVEVDAVIERGRTVIGIEIKSASKVTGHDFRGLRHLRDEYPETFHHGYIIYTGKETVQFEEKLTALPVTALWS